MEKLQPQCGLTDTSMLFGPREIIGYVRETIICPECYWVMHERKTAPGKMEISCRNQGCERNGMTTEISLKAIYINAPVNGGDVVNIMTNRYKELAKKILDREDERKKDSA